MKLKSLNNYDLSGCFIAGGSVLSRVTKTEMNDIDIYPKSKEDLVETLCRLLSEAQIVNVSSRAVTLKAYGELDSNGLRQIIQVMTFQSFPTPESIFEKFDFTVCMGAEDCDTGDFHFHEDFWQDVASKTVRFNPKTEYPLASLIRLNKYRDKGYKIGKSESAKVALAVAEKGLPKSWSELEDAIGGTYGKSISLSQEGVEFTLERAYEVLGSLTDADLSLHMEEHDYSHWDNTYIRTYFGEPIEVYTLNGGHYVKDECGCLERVKISGLPPDKVKHLDNNGYVTAYKHLSKIEGDVYKGAVYLGNHNGVTYSPYAVTVYENYPYLYSYKNFEKIPHGAYWSEVKLPLGSIMQAEGGKIQSKAMILGEVKVKE